MTDDQIQAEAEKLAQKLHTPGTHAEDCAEMCVSVMVPLIAAALRRQREYGRKEAGRRWQTDAYNRGLEDGAREERERVYGNISRRPASQHRRGTPNAASSAPASSVASNP